MVARRTSTRRGLWPPLPLRLVLLALAIWISLAPLALHLGVDRGQAAILVINALLATWIGYRALGLSARLRERRRLLGYAWEELDELSGRDFERWVALRLEAAGFRVETTSATGDFGIDLLVHHRGQKLGLEVKRRKSAVGNDVVRSVVGGARYHGCTAAGVVTQSRITREAERQAAGSDLPLALIDRQGLPRIEDHLRDLSARAKLTQRKRRGRKLRSSAGG